MLTLKRRAASWRFMCYPRTKRPRTRGVAVGCCSSFRGIRQRRGRSVQPVRVSANVGFTELKGQRADVDLSGQPWRPHQTEQRWVNDNPDARRGARAANSDRPTNGAFKPVEYHSARRSAARVPTHRRRCYRFECLRPCLSFERHARPQCRGSCAFQCWPTDRASDGTRRRVAALTIRA